MKAMSTVAEQLRTAREAQNLTVEEVAEATKIRTDHVRALEAGKFNAFSATIYIRGSVKIYAQLLKLDQAPLLAVLDAELKGTEKFSEPPPLVETRKTILDALILLLAKLNWKVGVVGLMAVVESKTCTSETDFASVWGIDLLNIAGFHVVSEVQVL